MREIASKAQTVLHTATYYFATKERLFAECVRLTLREQVHIQDLFATPLPPQTERIAAAQAIGAKILEITRAFFSEKHHPWAGRLVVRAMVERVAEALEQMHGLLMLSREWFLPALRQVLPSLSEEQFMLWHISLWGQVSFYATAQPLILQRLQKSRYDEKLLETVGRHIGSTMLTALGLPGPA